ncbi:hypothetical protein [Jiulongibacter sp. NS-SX5]|uniref:hypothetical protein n=1 Tax=Jiulongibacter sp. NS-SX5 TaxID=3463854 RepID=UPI0040595C11
MRFLAFLVLVIIGYRAEAQYEDRGSWYIGPFNANAVGDYRDYLTQYGKETAKIGVLGGYLINPLAKSNRNSPVQVGIEIATIGWGTDPVDYGASDQFQNSHRYTWFNLVGRWRPVLSASKINPFADIFAGPALVSTRVIELLGAGESRRVFSETKGTKNYGFGAGAGFKIVKKNGELRYIDLGVYYQESEKVVNLRRNSFYIDQNGFIGYDQSLVKNSNVQLRLNLTGFL